MRVSKPNWVKHTDEKGKGFPVYSLSVHPDGTRLATGGLGSVLCVRWAHHGRFLASGSDDTVLMIWGLDPGGGGRVFGSDEVNVENWKALKRLVGHSGDIIDAAWSRDDTMLASVGIDKAVLIWDGYSFERLRKLDLHGDFVKGVCWDPVGNFLATQSDDKSVKIWDTDTWSLVKSVEDPFERSPKSTFFRRLSWSPDGAFIAASNAMNGPVFVAAVIEREGWNADISFVGHANTIEVAAFNPLLFFRANDKPGRISASCMLALGADDFSISIWRNTLHKPLVVLQNIFGMALLDLCWSNDGYNLYGCSEDGTICAISFDANEFSELASSTQTDAVLQEYGYKPQRSGHQVPRNVVNGFTASTTSNRVNVLQPRKGKSESRNRINLSRRQGLMDDANGADFPLASSSNPFASTPLQPFASTSDRPFAQSMVAAFPGNLNNRLMTSSARATNGGISESRAPRIALRSIGSSAQLLSLPSIQAVLRVRATQGDDSTLFFEAQNAPRVSGKNRVICHRNGQQQWLDFLPSPVIAMTVTSRFCVTGSEDGSVVIFSAAGRRLKQLLFESPCAEMVERQGKLFVITADCQARVIDLVAGAVLFGPNSIAHLLEAPSTSANRSSPLAILKVDVEANGVPIILTSEPAAFCFDHTIVAWTCIASSWWLQATVSSPRHHAYPPGVRTPLADLDREISQRRPTSPTEIDQTQWWNEALNMGYLETRIRAALLLESAIEYEEWLGQYAELLQQQGFSDRAEELIKELLGPRLGTSQTSLTSSIDRQKSAVNMLYKWSSGGGAFTTLAQTYLRMLQPLPDSLLPAPNT